jgi:hypothetical protein
MFYPLQKIPRCPYDEEVIVFQNGPERKHKCEDRTVIVGSVCMQSQCTIFICTTFLTYLALYLKLRLFF